MITNIKREMSLVSFSFHDFINWGTNDVVVSTAAANPISVIPSGCIIRYYNLCTISRQEKGKVPCAPACNVLLEVSNVNSVIIVLFLTGNKQFKTIKYIFPGRGRKFMAGTVDQKAAGSSSPVPQKTMVMMSIERFPVGLSVPFEVCKKEGNAYSCVLKKWQKFDQDIKDALKSKGIIFLYVEGETAKVNQYFDRKPAEDKATETAFAAYSKNKEAFHNVSKLIFSAGSRVNFSIYKVSNLRHEPIIETLPEKPVLITDAVRNADGDIAIKVSDMKLYREYLFALSKNSAADNSAKITAVKEGAKMSVRDVLADPGNSKNVDNVVSSANQILNMLKHKDTSLSIMLTKNARDLYIYNHSTNVSVLSAAMALAMGMDQGQIEKLAIGAIMHDVGKRNIPLPILQKRERLTDDEFSVWKKHVSDGLAMVQSQVPVEACVAVKQHHERLSGKGYPYGLSGRMLALFGRIISIVDCYDSLTTPRPLRTTCTPYMALETIMKETTEKGNFDLELVKLFVKILRGQGRL